MVGLFSFDSAFFVNFGLSVTCKLRESLLEFDMVSHFSTGIDAATGDLAGLCLIFARFKGCSTLFISLLTPVVRYIISLTSITFLGGVIGN